jgi:maltose/moltooligosaccharide transporter
MTTTTIIAPAHPVSRAPVRAMRDFWGLFNLSFGFFGIQIAFALQAANVSRIFQSLGAQVEDLPILWIAAPLTGLLVQPLVGFYSDRTWSRRWGRRRPYFLAGAVLATIALALFPDAHALWFAAGLLWLLDGSINVAMEPFRAFVGDLLDKAQHTAGYAFQTVFIGSGAVVASLTPTIIHMVFHTPNTDAGGGVPQSVRIAFYLGAAVLLGAVLWTVFTTIEYPPEPGAGPLARRDDRYAPPRGALWLLGGVALAGATAALHFDAPVYVFAALLAAYGLARLWTAARARAGAATLALGHVLADLDSMPPTMRKLAAVQFCTWFGLFVLWIFTTPVVTARAFGAAGPGAAGYAEGADWVGVMFAVYNGVAAVAAFALPALARRFGAARAHQGALLCGAAGFAGLFLLHDRYWLLVPMIGIGIAWAGVLTLPYTILCDVCPPERLGGYMGLFNIFITLPQLLVSTIMGLVMSTLFPHAPEGAMLIAAGAMILAALATQRLVTPHVLGLAAAAPATAG